MNREEFISYLRNPASLDKKSLPEINELIEEFPFFQSGHLLFLKNLHNLDHIRFGSQLKKSSSIVSDRERLYDLLFPATGVDTELPVEKKIELEDTGVVPAKTGSKLLVEKVEEDDLPEESPKSDFTGNSGDLREQVERRLAEIRGESFQEVKTEEQGQEEGVSEAGELLLLGDEKEVDDLYDDSERINSEDLEEVLYKKESLLDLDYPEDVEDEEKKTVNHEREEATPSSKVEIESKTESGDIEDKADLKEEIHSFESWLSLLKTKPSEGDKDSFSQEVKKPVSNQREIIDKFILENPRIQPNHEDKDDKGDMSAESITDKDGLFTETLANIYVKQGYYSKAIFFYQELSLKFPEKSIYFARRIKEIEKRINKL